ncbi:hypothetical protein [Micromonospora sp. C81]|uniref:hypothetical protein n=1 Tax=Micromonospora sp. C81 TaxID=2824881 RepID=UPI001B368245|nr:hypothetical protein [Micromonospora sp. C81]MBQ1034805.1 hypothetical protein [Micromonospora sp. C81]
MSTLLTQLPALLGVLVGTLGTILATSLADRARWRRSQSVRWDERRLDAYVDYAHALKESHAVALRMTADLRPGSHSHPIDREDGLARLATSDARRTIVWENLLLLGDEPTVVAAAVWRDAVWQVERLARGIVASCDVAASRQMGVTALSSQEAALPCFRRRPARPRPRCRSFSGVRRSRPRRAGGLHSRRSWPPRCAPRSAWPGRGLRVGSGR